MSDYHLVRLFINVVYFETVCVALEKLFVLDSPPSFSSNILKKLLLFGFYKDETDVVSKGNLTKILLVQYWETCPKNKFF